MSADADENDSQLCGSRLPSPSCDPLTLKSAVFLILIPCHFLLIEMKSEEIVSETGSNYLKLQGMYNFRRKITLHSIACNTWDVAITQWYGIMSETTEK